MFVGVWGVRKEMMSELKIPIDVDELFRLS